MRSGRAILCGSTLSIIIILSVTKTLLLVEILAEFEKELEKTSSKFHEKRC